MTKGLRSGLIRLLIAVVLFLTPVASGIADDAAERIFTLKVLPLLKVKCFGCHSPDKGDLRGDLDLTTREKMLQGGESGDAALAPGKPDESLLYHSVLWQDLEMPPKENDRLTAKEVGYIKQWIIAGAPWPDENRQRAIQKAEWSVKENEDGVLIETSGGTDESWTYRRYSKEDLWAFQPIRKVEPADGTHPIDFFIDEKLNRAGITKAKEADPNTLIRRASYDLIGLPPSPEQVKQFVAEYKRNPDQAWTKLIDRLLESKQYGERWAQHWLDVVRYADTSGFSNDYERSNAWRYRDYVIRSFNKDKPYDQFVREQLAGDELDSKDSESVIATGFLRMGPWGTAMIPQNEARQIYLDDLVHNVGQTFMSLPLRCCKCHDHKFDPIPTRDYYRLYATFATTQPAEMPAEFLPEENQIGFEEEKKLVEELLNYARSKRDEVINKQEAAAKKWYAENNLPYKNENARRNDPEDKKPPRHVGLSPAEKGIKKVREQDVWIWERRLERFQPIAQAVYNGQDDWKNGRKLRQPKNIRKNWRPKNFILSGGALEAPSDEVGPGVLSATGVRPTSQKENGSGYKITDQLSGRRLELANWMVDSKHPLTARSICNRIWQYHFGVGLVKTANNFGAKGSKPSHPQLLDWLASDLMEHGWTLKRMHRQIMLSKTYRRAHESPDVEKRSQVDPENRLLSSFPERRLSAEELRDSMLFASGELDLTMGGLPIKPEINMEVALQPRMIQFSIAPAYQPSRTPNQRNRRTIYAYRVRGQADPFLEVLNQPNPNESCELRDSAAVTPQAFTLFNSQMVTDRSIAMAKRIQAELPGKQDLWINHAFELALARKATTVEREKLAAYFDKMLSYHRTRQPQRIEYPKEVERSLVEEFTGQPFIFIEKLNVFNDYVPDDKPWTVKAETRALADICLLLMNSNEFVYVY